MVTSTLYYYHVIQLFGACSISLAFLYKPKVPSNDGISPFYESVLPNKLKKSSLVLSIL